MLQQAEVLCNVGRSKPRNWHLDVLSAAFDSKNLLLKTIPRALWIPKEQTAEIWLYTGRFFQREGLELLKVFWRRLGGQKAVDSVACSVGMWPHPQWLCRDVARAAEGPAGIWITYLVLSAWVSLAV